MAATAEGKLFISYASEDSDAVEKYRCALAAHGVTVWLDRNELVPSDDLVRRINDGIASSQYAVLFYSQHYVRKIWTNTEQDAIVHAAIVGKDRRVFVVRLDGTELPPLLSGKLYFAASMAPEEVARRMAAAIHREVPRSSSAMDDCVVSSRVSVDNLQEVSIEALAQLLLVSGLARVTGGDWRPESVVAGYVHGVGDVRVRLRVPAVTRNRFWDFESTLSIAVKHEKYIGHLERDLSKGGLGIFGPAWRIEVEERTGELAKCREQLRLFLRDFVSSVEVTEPLASEAGG